MSYIKNIDCFDEFENIKKKSIDLVMVDLPYGQTNFKWDTKIDLNEMWRQLKKICKKKTIYIFFCTSKFGYELIKSNPCWFRYDLIWEKSNIVGFLSANKMPLRKHEMIYIFGDKHNINMDIDIEFNLFLRNYACKVKNYINKTNKQLRNIFGNQGLDHFLFRIKTSQFSLPIKKNYEKLTELFKLNLMKDYMNYEEMKKLFEIEKNKNKKIYTPQKTKGKPYKTPKRITKENENGYMYRKIIHKPINNTGDRYPSSILKFGYDKEKLHPTQKPILLCEYLIKTYSSEGDTVLDFTMGSGSTCVACINTNRKYIGIEKDKNIFMIAEKRINKYIEDKKNISI